MCMSILVVKLEGILVSKYNKVQKDLEFKELRSQDYSTFRCNSSCNSLCNYDSLAATRLLLQRRLFLQRRLSMCLLLCLSLDSDCNGCCNYVSSCYSLQLLRATNVGEEKWSTNSYEELIVKMSICLHDIWIHNKACRFIKRSPWSSPLYKAVHFQAARYIKQPALTQRTLKSGQLINLYL